MKFWFGIFIILFTSCKQNAFIKRHYMQGLYIEGHSNRDSEKRSTIHRSVCPKKPVSKNSTETKPIDPLSQKCTDTLFLIGKSKIPCKVKTIDQKYIHYQSCFKNDSAEHIISNQNVKEIHFYN